MKTAFVFLADGFEEVEAVTPIDYLRRSGVNVTVVGVTGKTVMSARNLSIQSDCTLKDVYSLPLPDLAVLPGGGAGSKNLAASKDLRALVTRMDSEGKIIGAICAAPAVVLGSWDLLRGRKWTCYPGCENGNESTHSGERIVVSGTLVTSRGAGTAEEFALTLVGLLSGAEASKRIANDVLAR